MALNARVIGGDGVQVRDLAGAGPRVQPLSVAGLADLERWLGAGTPIVRTMPNRPALIGAGVTALYAGNGVTARDRDSVEVLMSAAGATAICSLPFR